MKLRIARHTTDLNQIVQFYSDIIGLEVIGKFKDHGNYNGVYLGLPGLDWHLEFTTSDILPNHFADEDDLLVFYLKNITELNVIKEKCRINNIKNISGRNPYWSQNGFIINDPDGYKIVIAISI